MSDYNYAPLKRFSVITITLLSLFGYGYFVFAAPNLLVTPVGGYNPGTELDPVCPPNQLLPEPCIVKTPSGSTYLAGTGLTLTGTTFSLTPVGTAGTYGSTSSIPVMTTNASGQVVSVTNTPIILSSSQITPGTNGQVLTTVGGVTTWTTPGVGGTVTSVGLTLPSIFSVSGSPVTTTGTLAATLATQSANTIFAGPTTGAAAAPTFRTLVVADLPSSIPNANLANSSITINAGTGLTGGGTVSLGGTLSPSLGLPNTGTAGTYGSATQVPVFTTDAQGRVTGVTNTTITPAVSSLTGAANVTAGSTKVTLGGTPTGAVLKAFSVDVNEANLSLQNIGGALSVTQQNAINFSNVSGSVNLASQVSGILPVANGGTGQSSLTTGSLLVGNGTSPVSLLGAGTNGHILSMNTGTPTWVNPNTVSLVSADNGLTVTTGNVQLGGTLIKNTNINQSGFLYSLTDTYSSYQSGNNGLITANWMRKDITPSQFTVNGIADISGFGGDVDTVFLGRLSTLGAPVTNIIISPTTGNINGHATNNIDFKADSNLSLKTDNNLYLESSQDLFTTAKNSWIGGVSDGTITAGQYRADFAMNPFTADPVTIFELKKNQNYAMGFAALDTPGHQFSNIYYGVLDATNTITDITRLEANQDEAHMFARNIPGTLNSKLAIFPDMLEYTVVGFSRFTVLQNGETGVGIDNFDVNTNGNIFQVGNGGVGIIGYVDDSTGNWVAISDARKKDHITDLPYGLDTLMKLTPKSYAMKSDGQKSIGFLAQEVKDIVPESVFGSEEKGYGMAYQTLVPVTVKAIQELNLKLESIQKMSDTVFTEGVSSWLGNKLNGIQKIFTREICLTDGVDEECITMQELRQLKQGMQISSPSSTAITSPETTTSPNNTTSSEIADPQTQTDNPIVDTSESVSSDNNTSSNSNEENTIETGIGSESVN